MFNPLKMAGDMKGMEKMLKPALEKFMQESGFVKESEFQLVETLAEKICQIILNEFDVSWVKLKLNKGEAITGAEGVGVIIERSAG